MLRGASCIALCAARPTSSGTGLSTSGGDPTPSSAGSADGPTALQGNPYRGDVLRWYRKMLKAAFDVDWPNDEDAEYVLDETRRMFRRNQHLREVALIQRKVFEAEARYTLAVHYKIPYPRMYHHTQGAEPGSGVEYSAYLDSCYDGDEANGKYLMEPGRRTGWVAAFSPGTGQGAFHVDDKKPDEDYDKQY
uniref:Complex 1 LYR protein domain-containing protein n=1 Tax=Neobodo designis TaxID=312471 RepID=A0A7S1QIG7_NEODS|mmetsp:Transcript_46267/g.142708  ORF Transcript_46267/g.142708 Transcript_46267/m.142708 type:complete len:192 (+) Transcript_46267:51-626(+)